MLFLYPKISFGTLVFLPLCFTQKLDLWECEDHPMFSARREDPFGGGEHFLWIWSWKRTGIWPTVQIMKVWTVWTLVKVSRTACDQNSLWAIATQITMVDYKFPSCLPHRGSIWEWMKPVFFKKQFGIKEHFKALLGGCAKEMFPQGQRVQMQQSK